MLDLDIGAAVCLSVRLSVCLSVTSRYHVKINTHRITRFPPFGSPLEKFGSHFPEKFRFSRFPAGLATTQLWANRIPTVLLKIMEVGLHVWE